ncbi:MAG: hypothetical protein HPM95_16840 [Alphaproteobacteria bacterium]|nr:hypothetical protein [Alphaproteobacteria bacterium]
MLPYLQGLDGQRPSRRHPAGDELPGALAGRLHFTVSGARLPRGRGDQGLHTIFRRSA